MSRTCSDALLTTTKADLNNKDSLVKAFKGSYAVFAVTNYWESLDMQVEIQQGKNIADAAKVRTTGYSHETDDDADIHRKRT